MDCVIVPELLTTRKGHYNKFRNDYKLDFWLELKKRWLILGVLASVLLAVVSPRIGAPGGSLHSEYLSYAPLSYIYYSSGRRARAPQSLRASVSACALATAHAHVVAPILCAFAASTAADAGLHNSFVKGAMLSAAGGPCAWLSLCVSRDTTTAALCLATSYVVSMAAAPTALYIICGFAPTPALGQSIWPALCTLPPFIGGVLYTRLLHKYNIQCENIGMHQKTMDPICEKLCEHELRDCPHQLPDCTQTCASVAKICALVLLYFDCCERLWDVEGSLHIVHVLGTMTFAVVYVCLSAVSWCVYARGGLAGSSARTLAVCAVPKALHIGWEAPAACAARGAGRLAAAFVAPAQALLVAALAAPR